MSSPRVLILGHSFVRRLRSFLASSHVYSSDVGLSDSADISLFGVCGRTVDKVIQFDLDVVRNSKPDIVILELGTNDLTSLPPESVGSELEELVQSLHCEFDVRVIAVFQVIKRITPFSRLPDFTELLGAQAASLFTSNSRATSHSRHIGVWKSSRNMYLREGVHLNTLGLIKLYRSYREGAVLKSPSLIHDA